jgi:hypothetical protein
MEFEDNLLLRDQNKDGIIKEERAGKEKALAEAEKAHEEAEKARTETEKERAEKEKALAKIAELERLIANR